ncbi:MAG: phage portal protein, partial [Alphaproteobacteria bacterium]|nr:phage portal protein [Alphaproteobacteria bacterium]
VLNKIANSSTLGAGNIITAGQNENLEFTDLKTPSNNYAPFKDVTINYIGMATGTPPEVITSKYSTSFTAHKGALNDFVKSFMYKRSILGSNVCDIVNSEILKDAVMNGYIKAPGFLSGNWRAKQAYLSGMYLGPVPGHINPLVEVKAKALSVAEAFELRSDNSKLNGNEHDNFITEWAREQEEFTDSPQTYAEKVAKQEELEVVENA